MRDNRRVKLKLGKGSYFVKSQLRRLPQEDDIWEADVFAVKKGFVKSLPCRNTVKSLKTPDLRQQKSRPTSGGIFCIKDGRYRARTCDPQRVMLVR